MTIRGAKIKCQLYSNKRRFRMEEAADQEDFTRKISPLNNKNSTKQGWCGIFSGSVGIELFGLVVFIVNSRFAC
mgnify:CR=1 FL=1